MLETFSISIQDDWTPCKDGVITVLIPPDGVIHQGDPCECGKHVAPREWTREENRA